MPNYVKPRLIQDTFIPKAVSFYIELLLKVASQHSLYLACIVFAIVE